MGMEPQREISPGRQLAYYFGGAVAVLGILTFGSVFVTAAMHFGDFTNFEDRARSSMTRALLGMALIVVGGVINSIGRGGAAGSGLILDPQQARKDLEPFNRAAGGMINDALDEVDAVQSIKNLNKPAEQVVKVRCRSCGALNSENARFCDQCGKQV
jgi:hypothetical protein